MEEVIWTRCLLSTLYTPNVQPVLKFPLISAHIKIQLQRRDSEGGGGTSREADGIHPVLH